MRMGIQMGRRMARMARVQLKALATGKAPLRGRRVYWPAPGRVTLEEFEVAGVGPKWLAIQNAFTVVSPGTERAFFLREPNTGVAFPYYPGYSSAGTVVLAGRGAPFRPGDRVASRTLHASLGVIEADRAARIPDGLPLEQAAFCHLSIIALQGVRAAMIEPGERVAVLGQGIIGLLAARLARCAGAGSVDGLRLSDAEAEQAGGGYGVVIEASGRPEAMARALSLVREGGRVVLLGSPRQPARNIDLAALIGGRGIQVTAAHISHVPRAPDASGARTWGEEARTVLRLMVGGRLQVKDLVTDRLPPADIPALYAGLASRDRRRLGILLDWTAEPAPTAGTPGLAARLGRAARAAVAAGRDRKAAAGKRPDPVRVALVGCGEIGQANARAIALAPGTTLSLVTDVNRRAAEDLARRYGVPFAVEAEDAFRREEVEAVFLCVPHDQHAPLALAAARAGKHLMVEKPIATNADDARRMIAAADEARVLLSVCFCQRYEPHIQRAAELIRAGALGEIIATKITYEEEKLAAYWTGGRTGQGHSSWRGRRAESGGGVLIMNISHYLDQLRYLSGLDPLHVAAEYGTMASPVEVEDLISLTYRYRNGAVGTVLASTCAPGGGGRDIRLVGRDGQMILQPPCQFYSIHSIQGLAARRWHPFGRLSEVDERVRYVDRFAQAIRNGWAADISGEDGLAIQVLIDAAYEAGRKGARFEIPRDGVRR